MRKLWTFLLSRQYFPICRQHFSILCMKFERNQQHLGIYITVMPLLITNMSYQILINWTFCDNILNSRILVGWHLLTFSCLLISTLYAMTVYLVQVYTWINMESRLLLIYSRPCQSGLPPLAPGATGASTAGPRVAPGWAKFCSTPQICN